MSSLVASGSPLKILYVLGQNAPGGTELQASRLIEGVRAQGHQTITALLDDTAGIGGLPGPVRRVGRRSPGPGGIGRLLSQVWSLRKLVKESRPDVVHSFHARGYVLSAVALMGLSVPHVAGRRNMGLHITHRAHLAAEVFSARRTALILVNSHEVASYWQDRLGTSAPQIEVVPNILDLSFFASALNVQPTGEILSVGALKPGKGHADLIDAVALLHDAKPSITILGEGTMRRDLAAQAKAAGVTLHLPGHERDPRRALQGCAVYVHPSHHEGSSNAVAEAMASGCAIIAADSGDSASLLGDAGIIVPPGEARILSETIERVMGDARLLAELRARARSRARSRLDPDAVVQRTINLYEGVLARCAE